MKINIVYSDNCPHCVELIDKLEKQNGITNMEIEMIEISTAEADELIKSHDIHSIPSVISDTGVECTIEYINGKVEIICPK